MRCFFFLFCFAGMVAPHARATYLFHNGDANIATNFLDCSTCRGAGGVRVYDDFDVPASGWMITGISGNYFFQTTSPTLPSVGTWEIRTGMAQGVLGTLVATGTTSLTETLTSNPTGCNCPSIATYNIAVTIPTLVLTQGTYWVTLAPDSAPSEPFLWSANGTNGTNAKIDGLSFATGPFFPSGPQNLGNYESQFGGPSQIDFSMQLTGVANSPEPGAMGLVSLGIGLGLMRSRRRR